MGLLFDPPCTLENMREFVGYPLRCGFICNEIKYNKMNEHCNKIKQNIYLSLFYCRLSS